LSNWSSTEAVLTDDKLTIPIQTVEGHTISGEGFISSNYKTISWTYDIVELKKSGSKEAVTAVYTR